jgi:catechol 2,3-dioxygenase-like lactoylglutathione lyase family enzyme
MKVVNIDHFNIRTPKAMLEKVKQFYGDLFGMTPGYRPHIEGAPGIWLYAGENPLLHLSEDESRTTPKGEDFFDHLAFRCVGVNEFIQKLTAMSIPYRAAAITEIDLIQLFFVDPAGITIELNFKGEQLPST